MSNRQLKFRAWDTLAKKFTYPDKGYQGHYVLTLNGEFWNLQNGSGGDEYVVQQFTGLKDPKGIDIYEGDIVRYKLSYINYFYDEVKWEHNGWRFVNVRDKSSFPLVTNLEDLEIIGNIFEAPELLEQ